jgi:hypothetical protein
MIGSGTCTSKGSSRRDARVRSMSRHTRATTVVSHPRKLSTPLTSVRLNRIHASWTASSASPTDPSMRYAAARMCGRYSSNCSASRSGVTITHLPVTVRHRTDGRNAPDVTGPAGQRSPTRGEAISGSSRRTRELQPVQADRDHRGQPSSASPGPRRACGRCCSNSAAGHSASASGHTSPSSSVIALTGRAVPM